jgi:sugar-specific transcriptional regulator TrmB
MKRTLFQRSSIYDVLNRLIKKGIVSTYTKDFKTHFVAEDPKVMLSLLEEKKKRFESILPKLIQKNTQPKSLITVHEGAKALKKIFMNIAEDKEITYVIGASQSLKEILGEPFFYQFQKAQKEVGNKVKMIRSEASRGKPSLKEISNADIRFISEEYSMPSHTLIQGNKVIINIMEDIPSAIVIESAQVADSYKNFFFNLWKSAKE